MMRAPRLLTVLIALGLPACGGSSIVSGEDRKRCQDSAFARAHPSAESMGSGVNVKASGKRTYFCMFTLPVPAEAPRNSSCLTLAEGQVNVDLEDGKEVVTDMSPPDSTTCYVRP